MCDQVQMPIGAAPAVPAILAAAAACGGAATVDPRCGDAAGRAAARRSGCSAETCPVALRVRCWLEAAARDPR